MGGFINEHGTKLYGGLTAFFGTLQALITTGSFDKLMSAAGIGWLGIVTALTTAVLGSMTMARGFNNTAQVKVATVIDNALNAEPPKQAGFARLSMLAFVAALAMSLLSACTTNPDGSRELTATGKVALQEVASIVVSRHFRESPRAAEHAQEIRTLLTELAQLPDVTTVAALRQVVQLRIDERVSDPYDRQDYTRLLNILSAVLSDYVGSGQLDAGARVKVTEFLSYVAAAIPEVQPPA